MGEKVIVAGGTGFIGSALIPALGKAGYEVVALVRKEGEVPGARAVKWDGRTLGPWAKELDDAAAVINLAGEPISQRWTPDARKRILDSRLESVHAIGEAVRAFASRPVRWVNASAVGYYGNRGEAPVTEESLPGTGFLAETCVQWEQAVVAAYPSATRVRVGMVLGRDGGALPVLARLARLGLGGPVGHGRQGVPWIHRDDLVGMMVWLLGLAEPPTVINGVAGSVSNAELMKEVRRAVGRPFGLPAPAFGVRLLGNTVGPDADLVLEGAFVEPAVARRTGFEYRSASLAESIRSSLEA
ncbi:MAG: TIGR01777 family oxidoreductase [Fimbriimonas sp.]